MFVYLFLMPLPAASCCFQGLWHCAKKPFWTSLLSQSCYVSVKYLWNMIILFHQSAVHIQLLGSYWALFHRVVFCDCCLSTKYTPSCSRPLGKCQFLTCKSSVHASICTTASRLLLACRDCFNCMIRIWSSDGTCDACCTCLIIADVADDNKWPVFADHTRRYQIVRLSCLHVQFWACQHVMSSVLDLHVQCGNLQHLAIQPKTTHHQWQTRVVQQTRSSICSSYHSSLLNLWSS